MLWNLCTAAGAAGAQAFADPAALGLDAVAPAAFLALLAPRLRGGRGRIVALAAVVVALAGQTVLAAGLPILLAGAVTTALAWPSEPAQP